MFRQLANWFQLQNPTLPPAQQALAVLRLHPMQLSRFLEEVWEQRADPPASNRPGLPSAPVPGALASQERISGIGTTLTTVPIDIYSGGGNQPAVWDHLIYAYLVENTRAYEIFRRVLWEYLHGERLGAPTAQTADWMRATEDLFYADPPPFQIHSVVSPIRPDIRASRRNAYYRMFGMDLNHGLEDNRPYPFEKPHASNRDFVIVFEEFLREVWRGVENFTNSSGARPTDDAAIANLAERLRVMLTVRRRGGNLSREEFFYVSTMSWFHLTLEFNSPVVNDLEAQAASPDERLRKIGDRVGLPAHARSQSYFELADAMSKILVMIEDGQFSSTANVPTLYLIPTTGTNPIRETMLTIVDHWSLATGRDMKARKVTVTPRVEGAPATNGRARPAQPAGV